MELILRRMVWSDGYSRPDDYNVIHEGQIVGRIYRMNSAAKETWRWPRSAYLTVPMAESPIASLRLRQHFDRHRKSIEKPENARPKLLPQQHGRRWPNQAKTKC
jgi:hypothetical protein